MSQQYTIDQGRAYVHETCGTTTIVSGNDFAGLCNPFEPCMGTVCSKCGPDSTDKFLWDDTGETVSSFRSRVRRESPGFTIWNWLVAPILGGVIGGMVMPMFGPEGSNPWIGIAIGAPIGALAMWLFIAPYITRLLAGKSFYDRK